MVKEGKKKTRILRWWGVLPQDRKMVRITVAVVLAVACATLAFTQLGFLGLGMPGEYKAYGIVLLLPVALSALLLGTIIGTAMGAFAGLMLYAHAIAMPLDYYELAFVTPLTSIVMLGVAGFLLGILFAFALRNDPPTVKRAIYICIVCIIVSGLYSVGFVFNVTVLMVFELAVEMASQVAQGAQALSQEETDALAYANTSVMAMRLGDMSLQMWFDAFFMALFCVVADIFFVRKGVLSKKKATLRSAFGVWLTVVVSVAFMITAAMSFVSVTLSESAAGADKIKGEVDYVVNQIDHSYERFESVLNIFNKAGVDYSNLDASQYEDLAKTASFETLLDGYTLDDGTIFILELDLEPIKGEMEDTDVAPLLEADEPPSLIGGQIESANCKWSYNVVATDDSRFPVGEDIANIVDDDMIDAIEESISTGNVQRSVFDEGYKEALEKRLAEMEDSTIKSSIVNVGAKRYGVEVVVMMLPDDMVYADRVNVMGWTALSVFVLLAAVFGMVFLLLNRLVIRRIDDTNGVLARITGGDLSARVEVRDTLEFESLSNGINETVGALKGWISEAETRMDAELATAKAIQESALPRTFPPYPSIQRFDVYALMHAAREVGGDFYDFFLIGDDVGPDAGKLAFVIADVSGKGVPAALFMMKAKTQIRDYLASGMEVGEAVENANRQLCDGNDAGMFVTVWVGVLDYATGQVDYVNAGHNPPLLWQKDSWRWLNEKSGLPLGLFEGFPYEAYSVDCSIGDQFLLYTDGVTEAMNVEGELYGEERLKELADRDFVLHPRKLVEGVRFDVALHAQGAEQSDDITILALEVGVPPEVTATLVVSADVGELPRVNSFIHTELDRRLCPLRAQNQLDIAVEELFVNVAHYAYPEATPDNPGSVRVNYTYASDPPSVTVQIADDGIPYNPLEKPDAVTPDDVMDVPIGGLGILMAKRSVNEMHYERIDESNIVTIVKKW